MIEPNTVMVAVPCGDGRIMAELAGALVMVKNRYYQLSMPAECSSVSLVRNTIADDFMHACDLKGSCLEWLVCVDSDTYFSPQDWDLLMQPTDDEYEKREGAPTPSSIPITEIVGRDLSSGKLLYKESPADMLVSAEYSYKNDSGEPVRLGMGFTRVHRSVFEKLRELRHDSNPAHGAVLAVAKELENFGAGADVSRRRYFDELAEKLRANLPDPGGGPRCWQMNWKGKLITDFYPEGPFVAQIVPEGNWKGEDHGFFTLCMLAGITPRIERRTNLLHIGRKAYPYQKEGAGI